LRNKGLYNESISQFYLGQKNLKREEQTEEDVREKGRKGKEKGSGMQR
jgi:hypothetical protein